MNSVYSTSTTTCQISRSRNPNNHNVMFLSYFALPAATATRTTMSTFHNVRQRQQQWAKNAILVFCTTIVLFFFQVALTNGQVVNPFSDIRGDYCRTRIGGCCNGRLDDCGTPILGTFCYCDTFCNRTEHPDCCPDYWNFCLGLTRPTPPPENITQGPCFHEGNYYPHGSVLKINCNQCKCEPNPGNPKQSEFLCEKDPCMIDSNLIDIINRGSYLWTSSNYSQFWGKKLADGLVYKLGTLNPQRAVRNMEPIKLIYDDSQLPRTFDSRSRWPSWIHRITDQGWCGSDWAMTTAAITADRLAIQSKGTEIVSLSTQHLLSCDSRGQQGCSGGHLDRTWNFMRHFGIVDEDCYPYKSGSSSQTGNCNISRKFKSMLDIPQCRSANTLAGRSELYRTQPTYRISSKENDIKYEIMTYGPVQAVMAVSSDFFMYRNGVYSKTGFRPDERIGYHSVRILGWGEEFVGGKMTKYWLIANTWGEDWGERGFFKLVRGENECEIETFVIAAWARPKNQVSVNNRKFWERNVV